MCYLFEVKQLATSSSEGLSVEEILQSLLRTEQRKPRASCTPMKSAGLFKVEYRATTPYQNLSVKFMEGGFC